MDDAPPPFDAIYEHAGFVRAMAIGVLGGDTEVEDVVQETWLVALRSVPRSPASLRSWLGGVSRRLALRTRRSVVRREAKHGRGARPEGTPSVAELATREEARRRLVQAVLALDEPYRAAILLRYVEDLPVREVAARQGVPLDTAKTRLRRGLERLRERLDTEHRGDRKAWASALVPFVAPSAAITAPVPGLLAVGLLAFAAAGALAAWQGWGPFEREGAPPGLAADLSGLPASASGALTPTEPELAALAGRASRGRGEVSGVVRRGWDPVAGARVEVRTAVWEVPTVHDAGAHLRGWLTPWLASRTIGVATTDTDGRYRVSAVGTGVHQVVAFAPDGQSAAAPVWVRAEGAHVGRDLEVTAHRESLAGRISHSDGRPWVGFVTAQRVHEAWYAWMLPPEAGPVRTDAAGRFRISGLDPGGWVLVGFDPGTEAIVDQARTVPESGEISWRISASGPDREVHVLADDDGSPIGGAEVLWATVGEGGEYLGRIRRVVSDATGVARVPGASLEWLRFTAPGFVEQGVSREKEGQSPLTEVRLARGARIVGRVTLADGTLVPGARVRFESLHGDRGQRRPSEAIADELGRYELTDLPPEEGVALVVGEAVYSPEALLELEANPEVTVTAPRVGETRTRDLVVVAASRVEGRVTNAKGTPVAGALVEMSAPEAARGSRTRLRDAVAATDAKGTYALVAPWPAQGSIVRVTAEDSAHGRTTVTTSSGGTLRADVVLGAPSERRVEVHVVAKGGGAPVAGARVVVRSAASASGDAQGVLGLTDADGIARLTGIPEGALAASAYAPLQQEKGNPVEVAAACAEGGMCVVTIAVSVRLSIAGLTTFEGAGVGGASVRLRRLEGKADAFPVREAVSDARGQFEFEDLSAGSYEATAVRGVGAERTQATRSFRAGDTDARLELRSVVVAARSAGQVVRILGPDGAPVPAGQAAEYRVSLLDRPGARFTGAGSFQSGRWQSGRLIGATSYYEAWGAATASGTLLPYGAVLAGPFSSEENEIVLRMPPERTIEGRVVGPDGSPAEGVLLKAWPVGRLVADDGPSSDEPSDRSDAEGRFRLRRLGAFRYRVTAAPPPRFALENAFEFESGARDAILRLRAGSSPSILVLGPEGRPVEDVEVTATVPRFDRTGGMDVPISSPPTARASTDAQGVARLRGLDPDVPYTLSVGNPGRTVAALPFGQARWAPVDTTIRLERAYRLAGVLRDPAGHPIHPAAVHWLSQPPGGWTGDQVRSDGSFAFTGLPSGETRLMVMLGEAGEYGGPPPEFPARAGDEHVELIVDPGLTLEVHISDWPATTAWGTAWMWRSGEADGVSRRSMIRENGIVTFHGLRPGSDFELVVRALADGRTLHRKSVRSDAGRLDVALVQGGVVEGRLLLPAGATNPSVWASGPHVNSIAQGTVEPDGHFVIRGIPEGRWVLQASAQLPGQVDGQPRFASGTVEASAGETVEIVLKVR